MNKSQIVKVGIAVDDWKLPIFERRLKGIGFTYTKHQGLTDGTSLLRVDTNNVQALQAEIERCQVLCAKQKVKGGPL